MSNEFFKNLLNIIKSGNDATSQKTQFLKVPKEAGEKVRIRILPPNEKTIHLYNQHWGFSKPLVCWDLPNSSNTTCPLCLAIKLYADVLYNKVDLDINKKKKIAKSIYNKKPQKAVGMYVFVVEDGKAKIPPVIWNTTPSFLLQIESWEEEGQPILDLENGAIVILKRREDGRLDKLPLGTLNISKEYYDVIDSLTPVSEIIKPSKSDDMEKALEEFENRVAYLFDEVGLNLFDFVPKIDLNILNLYKEGGLEAIRNIDTKTVIITNASDEVNSVVENNIPKIQIKSPALEDIRVGNYKFNSLEQKKKFINLLTGVDVDDKYLKCFASEFDYQNVKCMECPISINCESFIEDLLNDDSQKEIIDNAYNQAIKELE